MLKKEDERKYVYLLFALISLIFIVLYRRFIFGGEAFVYKDIGADTVSQYFPYYVLDGIQFRSGDMADYSLQMGLGGSAFQRIVALLNPFEVVLLLCNNENMYIGLLLAVYFKVNFIGFFAYMFFKEILSNRYSTLICTLIWTFCSYTMLWGQHYAFSTVVAYFTLFMFVLQRYLKHNQVFDIWVPVVVFLFALQSYYFLYMVGLFSVVYIFLYNIYTRASILQTVKKIVGLGLMALLGMAMAAFVLAVSIGAFFGCERSTSYSFAVSEKLWDFRDLGYLITVVGRLLSSDTLGVGNDFYGWGNYYEAPILFTSMLFVFSLVYSFLKKGRWLRAIFYILGVYSLFCGLVSVIMTGFSGEYLRWTFVLCFVMIMGIGGMLDAVLEKKENGATTNKICSALGVVIYFLLVAFLYKFANQYIAVDTIKTAILFVFIYAIWLLFFNQKYRDIYVYVLLCVVVFETIICNSATINQRDTLSKDETAIYISDYTVQLVEYMEENDEDIYRSRKTYGTVGLNDALAQGFNSLSWYESVVPESIMSYIDDNEIPPLLYRTCIDIPPERYNLLTLLGTRYIMAHEDYLMDEMKYERVYEAGDKVLYKNIYALPFGYLYFNQADKTDLMQFSYEQRDSALTRCFYYTNEQNLDVSIPKIDEINVDSEVTKELVALRENGLKQIKFDENILSGSIVNSSNHDAMLCVPIFYEKNWKAYLNGERCETFNINGGLIGIIIKPGEYNLQLVYENDYQFVGTIISIMGVVVYISLCCIDIQGRRKKSKVNVLV